VLLVEHQVLPKFPPVFCFFFFCHLIEMFQCARFFFRHAWFQPATHSLIWWIFCFSRSAWVSNPSVIDALRSGRPLSFAPVPGDLLFAFHEGVSRIVGSLLENSMSGVGIRGGCVP